VFMWLVLRQFGVMRCGMCLVSVVYKEIQGFVLPR